MDDYNNSNGIPQPEQGYDQAPTMDYENENRPSRSPMPRDSPPPRRYSRSPPRRGSPPPRRSRSPPKRPENPTPNDTIGVFGLSIRTREIDLEDEFSKFGQVDKVTIVYDQRSDRSRGFGFIKMGSVEDAEKCIAGLNGVEIHGRNIRVDFSTTKRPHSPTPGQYMGHRHPSDFRRGYDRYPRRGGPPRYGRRGRYDDDWRRRSPPRRFSPPPRRGYRGGYSPPPRRRYSRSPPPRRRSPPRRRYSRSPPPRRGSPPPRRFSRSPPPRRGSPPPRWSPSPQPGGF